MVLFSLLKIVKHFECIFACNITNVQQAAKLMMIAGAFVFLLGALFWAGGKYFQWFGHLPGDVRIEKENMKFYMPVTSMIIVSVALSLFFWILRKLFS